jgi:hypothetical protein
MKILSKTKSIYQKLGEKHYQSIACCSVYMLSIWGIISANSRTGTPKYPIPSDKYLK